MAHASVQAPSTALLCPVVLGQGAKLAIDGSVVVEGNVLATTVPFEQLTSFAQRLGFSLPKQEQAGEVAPKGAGSTSARGSEHDELAISGMRWEQKGIPLSSQDWPMSKQEKLIRVVQLSNWIQDPGADDHTEGAETSATHVAEDGVRVYPLQSELALWAERAVFEEAAVLSLQLEHLETKAELLASYGSEAGKATLVVNTSETTEQDNPGISCAEAVVAADTATASEALVMRAETSAEQKTAGPAVAAVTAAGSESAVMRAEAAGEVNTKTRVSAPCNADACEADGKAETKKKGDGPLAASSAAISACGHGQLAAVAKPESNGIPATAASDAEIHTPRSGDPKEALPLTNGNVAAKKTFIVDSAGDACENNDGELRGDSGIQFAGNDGSGDSGALPLGDRAVAYKNCDVGKTDSATDAFMNG